MTDDEKYRTLIKQQISNTDPEALVETCINAYHRYRQTRDSLDWFIATCARNEITVRLRCFAGDPKLEFEI